MAEIKLIYVTTANSEEAERIAMAAVSERLAACANVLGSISSVYHWNGKLEQATEVALLLKTRESAVEALVARIRQLHSYDCPAIVVVPVSGGNPEYLAWILSETAAPDK